MIRLSRLGLLCLWLTTHFWNPALVHASSPTVLFVVDEKIVLNNNRIPKILEGMEKLASLSKAEADVTFKLITSSNNNPQDTLDRVCKEVEVGVVAIVDMTSPNVAPLLRSLAGTVGITLISAVDSSLYRYGGGDEEATVTVEPSAAQMLEVVSAIVVKESLNNVAILYDDTFNIQNTPRRVLTNVPAQHLYVRVTSNATRTAAQVALLRRIEIKSIFVVASRNTAAHFLAAATVDEFDINWFVLSKDYLLGCLGCQNHVRVVFIRARPQIQTLREFMTFMKAYVNTDYQIDSLKVDEAFTFDLARITQKAIAQVPGIRPIVRERCCDVTAPNDSDRNQSLVLTSELRKISVNGVYSMLRKEGEIIRNSITLEIREMKFQQMDVKQNIVAGNWTEAQGLSLSVDSLVQSNKRRTYKVVTISGVPPFVYKEEGVNGSGPIFRGYCIDLLDKIKAIMDFDYEIYESPDGLVGSMADDESWSGVMNELIQKRADIAVGPISVMAERENVVDFTVPYYDLVGLTILIRRPNFNYSLVKFLSVLEWDVWTCIIAAFFLFSALICVFDKLSPYSYQNNKHEHTGEGAEPRIFTLKEGVWFCMMSLTPQGGGETPRALSGRLVAATWWLFGFIIIATYTANLAAFLTVSRLETPIESLDDLSKQHKVKYAPMNGSNAQIYFRRMAMIEDRFYGIWKEMSLRDNMNAVERAQLAVWDYPVSDKYTKLWNNMKNSKFPNSTQEAIENVLTGEFAFIADATTSRYESLTKCELWEVGEEFSRKPYALAVQEGSPLRAQLSNAILQLINRRELEELKSKWWNMDAVVCPKVEDESDGISIRNIGGVFLVIVIGSGLALVTLAFECYWYKYRPQKQRKMYAVSSKTHLTNAAVSSTSLSKSIPNGHVPDDLSANGKTDQLTTVSNGKDDGLFNNGFSLELTERL